MKSKDELLYDLIFSINDSYMIDISDYIDDIYKHTEFVSDIRKILKKSKVMVVRSSIVLDSKTAIWELKVKK